MDAKPERMNAKLGDLYSDYMNEAHSGYPGRYTGAERAQQAETLLETGELTQGIDIYHAALLLDVDGSLDAKMRVFDLYRRAGELGYSSGFHSAALVYDGWLTAQGKKQRYGTHWSSQEDSQGNPIPAPLEDPDRVDEFRAELHLPPLASEAAQVATMNRQVRELQEKTVARAKSRG